jgi:hypothetical protein
MSGNPKEKLATLKELLDEGLISKEDFEKRKKLLLDEYLNEKAEQTKPASPRKANVFTKMISPRKTEEKEKEQEKESDPSKWDRHMWDEGDKGGAFMSGETTGARSNQRTGSGTPGGEGFDPWK